MDFILNSVQYLLHKEFDRHLSDENIHILDPFTGTGTFITRLLQNHELIKDADLQRKYANELHANEIVLLAYYIATINIENAFHHRTEKNYQSFQGAVLTDTFQMAEKQSDFQDKIFKENRDRANTQNQAPI